MVYYSIKVLFSAVLIVLISEISKRSNFLGALIASLPLTSLLAIVWLYVETKNTEKIIALSYGIFWIVIPSLCFFLVLPLLLKQGLGFSLSLLGATLSTGLTYVVYSALLTRLGIVI